MMIKEIHRAFMRLHILHHAAEEPVFGVGITEELRRHGYKVSPGTLYPMLHRMEDAGFLRSEKRTVAGKVRRFYRITEPGLEILAEARRKVRELFAELLEEEFPEKSTAGSFGSGGSADGRRE
jgi:DNA-binding PadR family transcriptional regulator